MYAYRPALDGVRALAVTAVLLFHGGAAALAGGFMGGGFLGVDAFFVLSGFLITSLLIAERAERGRIRLAAFWIRRARRLLPALLALLVAVVVSYRSVLAPHELALLRGDALAALGYAANWRMIYRGDDYFTQTSAPSPLQHTWSLGIEEQFYLLWPLLVAGLLAYAAARVGRGSGRGPLLLLCLAGAAESTLASALLHHPGAENRAYFGTDTRAQALLIGAALAVLVSWPSRPVTVDRRWTRALLDVAAIAAVATVGWLWTFADGTAGWLYHGGLTVGGVAVAVVLAHAVLAPGAWIGRVLAWAPLVWLGRISYGVYLWHWPTFLFANSDRTDLHGLQLLALRVALTIAIAAVSYVLIEQPVRTGRWPRPLVRLVARLSPRLRPSPMRPRLSAVRAGFGAVAIVGATGAVIVAATAPAAIGPPPVIALPSTTAVAAGPSDAAAPILRPGRRPGSTPRVVFLGDSVSWSLGTYLPEQPGLSVTVRAIQGCGIARLPDIIQLGEGHTNYPACPSWDSRWRRAIQADDPDVAVILLDRWELMDRRLGGEYVHVGQPAYDAYLTWELELAVSVAGERGARVVLLTAPYTRRAERPDGGLYDEDQPERVDAWNRLLRTVAAKHPDRIRVLDLNALVCPEGKFTWRIDGLRIRSDGLHFTEQGVQRLIAPWLMPRLAEIALGG